MKPGEVFNPRFEACGFHPEEIVAKRRDLTNGQKWLYDRLVRWARASDGQRPNERAGEVWRSHENIAIEMGKSAKQIGRDLAKLESKRLISHRKRDGRKSSTYFFLFHEDFERTPMSTQTEFERTRMSAQTVGGMPETEDLNGHRRPVRIDLNGHPRPSNQKVANQQEHTLPEESRRLKEPSAANDATANGSARSQSPPFRGSGKSLVVLRAWPAGGWESQQDFDAWWSCLLGGHSNKNRNMDAKARAVELIRAGQLERTQFEEGYAVLRDANSARWAEHGSRFAPNLLRILNDSLWKHAAPRAPAASEYQDAETYLRRVANE